MHLRCETQFRPSRSQKHAPDPQAGQSLPDDILTEPEYPLRSAWCCRLRHTVCSNPPVPSSDPCLDLQSFTFHLIRLLDLFEPVFGVFACTVLLI